NGNPRVAQAGGSRLADSGRDGFGYTLVRTTGTVMVAEPFGPVNWASKVDLSTGVPVRNAKFGTTAKKNTEGICPAAIGVKDQQPAAYSPQTGLFYVPANHLCTDSARA